MTCPYFKIRIEKFRGKIFPISQCELHGKREDYCNSSSITEHYNCPLFKFAEKNHEIGSRIFRAIGKIAELKEDCNCDMLSELDEIEKTLKGVDE
jgi:hypothetical protein